MPAHSDDLEAGVSWSEMVWWLEDCKGVDANVTAGKRAGVHCDYYPSVRRGKMVSLAENNWFWTNTSTHLERLLWIDKVVELDHPRVTTKNLGAIV